jgi:hypothetical protein
MQRLALNIVDGFIRTTPVDTGFARANWVPRIGQPFEGTAGTREDAEAGRINRGEQQAGIASVAAGYSLGPVINITNNVDYITSLNAGSSRKAPANFVQSEIFRAVRRTVANS